MLLAIAGLMMLSGSQSARSQATSPPAGKTKAQAARPAKSQAASAATWTQWRGPNRDALSPDKGLLAKWGPSGPPLAWKAGGLGG
ncbi:MAG: hypothetical protein ACRD5W_13730, partial [Candidatus Acidiferrales bacterium]